MRGVSKLFGNSSPKEKRKRKGKRKGKEKERAENSRTILFFSWEKAWSCPDDINRRDGDRTVFRLVLGTISALRGRTRHTETWGGKEIERERGGGEERMVGARSIVFPNRGTSRSQGLCGADTRRYYTARLAIYVEPTWRTLQRTVHAAKSYQDPWAVPKNLWIPTQDIQREEVHSATVRNRCLSGLE